MPMTFDAGPDRAPARRPGRARTGFAAGLLGTTVLGLAAGAIWGAVAPRAMLQSAAGGGAEIVSPETSAFISADAWYCGIAVVAGLIAGIAGYRLLVARRVDGGRAAAAGGLILGAVAGALVMMWLGEQFGLSAYHHHVASSPPGTVYPASLTLGAKSALACWPGLTAIVILVAEWSARRESAAEPVPASDISGPFGQIP